MYHKQGFTDMKIIDVAEKSMLDAKLWQFTGGGRLENNVCIFDSTGTAVQKVKLAKNKPSLIRCECESRAKDIDGNNAYEYSFLLKVVFADGSTNHLEWVPFNDGTLHYAEYASFSKGTHDWEKRSITLAFPKAVDTIEFNLMFENHSGSAEFRNAVVSDLADTPTFDAFPIEAIKDDEQTEWMIYLRDCEKNDISPLLPPLCEKPFEAHGIKLEVIDAVESRTSVIQSFRLVSDGSRDRAVTFYAAMRFDDDNITILPDMLRSVKPEKNSTFFDVTQWRVGANGLLSRFPFITIENDSDDELYSTGFTPDSPIFGRVGYSEATKQTYIAFDIALTPEKPTAEFKLVTFGSRKSYGFRGALEKYYSIFPEAYDTRIHEQGLWMPFVKISKVANYQDFMFRFKEGVNEEEWDREHGMLTFRYTEPMTLWMNTGDTLPENAEHLKHLRNEAASDKSSKLHNQTQILNTSSMTDENGEDIAIILDRPWCKGAVWSINSMPDIEGDITDFKTKWNDEVIKKYHTSGVPNEIAGEYIDSAEGYVTADISHRRDQFKAAQLPLSFAIDSLKPGIFKGSIVYEYVNRLRDEMLARGKYVMGNGTPGGMWFLPVLMDVAGTETDWCIDGKYTPMPLDDFCFRRSACAGKPYCFLMNTNFLNFTHEMTEKYMARSMAFGMFPGFFSANAATGHYFEQPSLYERDRDLFKKYLPAIKRIAEAGWEPVTRAKCIDSNIHIERFGEFIITILNESDDVAEVQIEVNLDHSSEARNMITNELYPFDGHSFRIALPPRGAAALEF